MANGIVTERSVLLFENVTENMKFSNVDLFPSGSWMEDRSGKVWIAATNDVVSVDEKGVEHKVYAFSPEDGSVLTEQAWQVCQIRLLNKISYVNDPVPF